MVAGIERGPEGPGAARREPRPPGVTLRQELVLRMAAMARQPGYVTAELHAAVVHPADRALLADCGALTAAPPDRYDEASVHLVVRRGDDVVGTARVTLWSPTVGFMVERALRDHDADLVLGPRTAEVSRVVGDDDASTALVHLAAQVAATYGHWHLYVLADRAPFVGDYVMTELARGVAIIDLRETSRRAS